MASLPTKITKLEDLNYDFGPEGQYIKQYLTPSNALELVRECFKTGNFRSLPKVLMCSPLTREIVDEYLKNFCEILKLEKNDYKKILGQIFPGGMDKNILRYLPDSISPSELELNGFLKYFSGILIDQESFKIFYEGNILVLDEEFFEPNDEMHVDKFESYEFKIDRAEDFVDDDWEITFLQYYDCSNPGSKIDQMFAVARQPKVLKRWTKRYVHEIGKYWKYKMLRTFGINFFGIQEASPFRDEALDFYLQATPIFMKYFDDLEELRDFGHYLSKGFEEYLFNPIEYPFEGRSYEKLWETIFRGIIDQQKKLLKIFMLPTESTDLKTCWGWIQYRREGKPFGIEEQLDQLLNGITLKDREVFMKMNEFRKNGKIDTLWKKGEFIAYPFKGIRF